jgi:uncharacterized protein YukE
MGKDFNSEYDHESNNRAEFADSRERRHYAFGAATVVLALAACAISAYCYSEVNYHGVTISQLVERVKSMDLLNGRVSKLETSAGTQKQLSADVQNLKQDLATQVRRMRAEANGTALRAMQTRFGTRVEQLESRMSRLESTPAEPSEEVAQLRGELQDLRDEVAQLTTQTASLRHDIDQSTAVRDQQLVGLTRDEEDNHRDVESVNHRLASNATNRIDFEVYRGHSSQLTHDISIGVTGIDVAHRRVSGWMWVMPDRRTIWLRGQGAQEPVAFYGYRDGKKRELVITNVSPDGVAGYLLLPEGAAADDTPAVARR